MPKFRNRLKINQSSYHVIPSCYTYEKAAIAEYDYRSLMDYKTTKNHIYTLFYSHIKTYMVQLMLPVEAQIVTTLYAAFG